MYGVRRVVPAALVLLVLAGCSSSGEDTSSRGAAAPGGAPALDADGAAKQEGGGVGTVTEAQAPNLAVDQRSIIYTGTLSVRTKDGRSVETTAADASRVATAAGGFVGSDKRSSGSDDARATLELRVPAEKFGAVVNELAALGTEEQRSIDTQDVTEQTLDLDARIKSQQARVDSGRALLAQAKQLSDLVMLEGELAKREADLASLQAKQRRLGDLTALSTITVTVLDKAAPAPAGDEPGFLGGLAAGWTALVASLKILLTVLGALLPWLIALGLPTVGVVWLLRRYRKPTPPPAVQAPAPTPAE
jgi:hypothetical protein